jgi:hypothetical protein
VAKRPWQTHRERVWSIALALVLLPLIAHLAFSSLGFNPMDDGFILASSRRLLDGEIPHRDFISIRPVGSSLLHVPEVVFGGHATFWLGRLVVWFEFALISWTWTRLFRASSGRGSSTVEAFAATCIAFVLTSHTFPVMPWHTVDGLVLISIGTLLAARSSRAGKIAGYALLGAAALCKQNFLPMAPIAVLILGDHRRWWAWGAALAAPVLYAVVLVVLQAAPAAYEQLGAQTDLSLVGVLPYASNRFFYGGLVLGAGATALALGGHGRRRRRSAVWPALIGLALVFGALLGVGLTINRDDYFYLDWASFLLFGAALGALASRVWLRNWSDPPVRFATLAVLMAWITSLSLGYRTPALAAGPLAAFLLANATEPLRSPLHPRADLKLALTTAALAIALLSVWTVARLQHVYHDRPASELTQRLDGVLPGGRFLRTNVNTWAVMADLQRAVELARGRPYAIVVDFAGYWVKAPQRNPLPIDWPQTIELSQPPLLRRVTSALEARRGHGVVIVQKIYAANLAEGYVPIRDGNAYYYIIDFVRSVFRKSGETTWFEIYE